MQRSTLDRVPQAVVRRSARLGSAVANLVNSPVQIPTRVTVPHQTPPVENIPEALKLAISRLQEDATTQQRIQQQLEPTSPLIRKARARGSRALQAADILATQVLPVFQATAPRPPDRTDASPSYVRRVVDAIQSHPEQAFTTAVLAGLASVSERSLQKGFMRHLGMSPTAYTRYVRLSRVHEELTHADPSATTVAEVAHRWGFIHLGRFSAAYRARYGVPPSHTLRAT